MTKLYYCDIITMLRWLLAHALCYIIRRSINMVGDRLKELRTHFQLTQQQLADAIGVKQQTVATWETGLRNPSENIIKTLLKTYRVNEAWLRLGDGEMISPATEAEATAAYLGDIMREYPETFRSRFIAATQHLTLKDWEDLARIAETLLQSKKKDADQ